MKHTESMGNGKLESPLSNKEMGTAIIKVIAPKLKFMQAKITDFQS